MVSLPKFGTIRGFLEVASRAGMEIGRVAILAWETKQQSTPNPTSSQLLEIFHLIQSKESPGAVYTDQIIWTASKNGDFTLSSTMEVINFGATLFGFPA